MASGDMMDNSITDASGSKQTNLLDIGCGSEDNDRTSRSPAHPDASNETTQHHRQHSENETIQQANLTLQQCLEHPVVKHLLSLLADSFVAGAQEQQAAITNQNDISTPQRGPAAPSHASLSTAVTQQNISENLTPPPLAILFSRFSASSISSTQSPPQDTNGQLRETPLASQLLAMIAECTRRSSEQPEQEKLQGAPLAGRNPTVVPLSSTGGDFTSFFRALPELLENFRPEQGEATTNAASSQAPLQPSLSCSNLPTETPPTPPCPLNCLQNTPPPLHDHDDSKPSLLCMDEDGLSISSYSNIQLGSDDHQKQPPTEQDSQTADTNHVQHEQNPQPSYSIPLFLDYDEKALTQYQCLLRQQLELFEAGPMDMQETVKGRIKPIRIGQLGLRCRHCAPLPVDLRARGAVYYPGSIEGVYQIAQNMAKKHLSDSCNRIPSSLKQKLKDMFRSKKGNNRCAPGGKIYWVESLAVLGVYEDETNDMLRLKHPSSS